MRASFRALVADIIDYAGLFPPAELSLDEAIRDYASYNTGPEAWMLARFVCPAARLGELTPYMDEFFSAERQLRLSILGRGGTTREQFLDATRLDLTDMAGFREKCGHRAEAEAFEVRLPDEVSEADNVSSLLCDSARLWDAHRMTRPPTFCEPSPKVDRRSWPAIIRGIAQHNGDAVGEGNARNDAERAGFKLRCGGLDASAYPSVEQVASVLTTSRACEVPMKFTAGLHHPLRHYNENAGVGMHGFINVFVSGILADSGKVGQERLSDILSLEEMGRFEFTAEGMSVDGVPITTDEIARGRRRAVTSFGSCSFDEPLDDLRALGWL